MKFGIFSILLLLWFYIVIGRKKDNGDFDTLIILL